MCLKKECLFFFRGQLKDELHGMTYLMELVDYVMKEASGDTEYQGAVGGVHSPLNLSNQQVYFCHQVFF